MTTSNEISPAMRMDLEIIEAEHDPESYLKVALMREANLERKDRKETLYFQNKYYEQLVHFYNSAPRINQQIEEKE